MTTQPPSLPSKCGLFDARLTVHLPEMRAADIRHQTGLNGRIPASAGTSFAGPDGCGRPASSYLGGGRLCCWIGAEGCRLIGAPPVGVAGGADAAAGG